MPCKQETLLLTTGRELSFQTHNCDAVCECLLELHVWFREILTYADDDRTCDYSWLMMLLGNTTGVIKPIQVRFSCLIGLYTSCLHTIPTHTPEIYSSFPLVERSLEVEKHCFILEVL